MCGFPSNDGHNHSAIKDVTSRVLNDLYTAFKSYAYAYSYRHGAVRDYMFINRIISFQCDVMFWRHIDKKNNIASVSFSFWCSFFWYHNSTMPNNGFSNSGILCCFMLCTNVIARSMCGVYDGLLTSLCHTYR